MARLFLGTELIDDDWHPLDDTEPPEFVPAQWNGPHVGHRLTDAWRILAKMPWRSPAPRAFGHTWPNYKLEWHDLLALVGGGELEAVHREQNRTRLLPSAKEISQMEQAIGWPWRYLSAEIFGVRCILIVNTVSRVSSFDGDLGEEMRRRNYDGEPETWRKAYWRCCDAIADGLIGERVVVF